MAPRIRIRDDTNTLRTVTQLRFLDETDTLRTITRVRLRDANNVLRVVYDTTGSSTFSASSDHVTVNGFSAGTGTVTTAVDTITPSGGTAPYTYAWAVVSYEAGVSPTATAPAAAATAFTQTGVAPGEILLAVFRCTVTDSAANTTTVDVNARFVDVT
jgi:hypothetical protein